jgi:predicted ester cyclase
VPTPQDALSAALDRWNERDLEGYLGLYDEAIAIHGQGPTPIDKQGAREFYTALTTALDHPRLAFDEILWCGDDACTIRFTLTGHHVGTFMGVPPANEPIVLTGITIMRFRDGRVVERHTTSDMLGLLIQIGAVPTPAPA